MFHFRERLSSHCRDGLVILFLFRSYLHKCLPVVIGAFAAVPLPYPQRE
jgi:hypothetical protein